MAFISTLFSVFKFPTNCSFNSTCFFCIQSIIISIKYQFKGSSHEYDIFQCVFLFHYLEDPESTIISGVVITSLTILISLWMLVTYLYFKLTKISHKSNLIIVGIFGHLLLPILVVSCSFACGYHVMVLFEGSQYHTCSALFMNS